jgi:hypothetical protein
MAGKSKGKRRKLTGGNKDRPDPLNPQNPQSVEK